MAYKQFFYDGQKSIPLNSLPEEAWTVIRGDKDQGDAAKLYDTVAYLYRCIEVRANALVALPWYIMRGETVVWSHADEEAPKELKPLENFTDLLWQTEASLCLSGQAFWQKERNLARLLNVRWLAPWTMMPKWDADEGLVGFERKIEKRKPITFDPSEIVYLTLPGTHETKPRRAPAEVACAAAKVLFSMDEFARLFFERGAVKATLLTVEGNPPLAEREKLKSWWNRTLTSLGKAFSTEVISAMVKPVVIGEGVGDLGNTGLTVEKRQDIATAVGVPHSLVMSDAANYATAMADRLNLYDLTVIPQAKIVQRQLNRQQFGPMGLRLLFKPEELSIYQEDEKERAGAVAQYVSAGVPIHIAMQLLGVDLPVGISWEDLMPKRETVTVVEPKEPEVPKQLEDKQEPFTEEKQQPVEDATAESKRQAKNAEIITFKRWHKRHAKKDVEEFKSDILSDDDKLALVDEWENADHTLVTLPIERITPASLKTMLLQLDPDDDEAEQKIRMAVERRSEKEIHQALQDALEKLYPDGFGDAFDPDAIIEADRVRRELVGNQKFKDALNRAMLDSADLGVSVGIDQLERVGFGFDYTLAHISARDWAVAHTDEILRSLADVTQRGVGQAIARWAENGEPLSALVADIEPFFGRRRAKVIASTEVTRAYYEGTVASYRQSGVIQKLEWRTARDERVCPQCGPLHGSQTDLGGTFNGVTPPYHPRCRCWVVPVVESTKS